MTAPTARINMQISITRTGGYAGKLEYFLDTSRLERGDAARIEQTIRKNALYALARDPGGESIGADMQKCDVTIVDGDRRQRVVFTEDGSPGTEPLTNLINELVSVSQLRQKPDTSSAH
jgi:hypothetical protein